jgi:hypothetical protein
LAVSEPISAELAQQCLAAVIEQFAAAAKDLEYTDEDGTTIRVLGDPPHLVEAWTKGQWAIVWESGPDNWAERAFVGGHDTELANLAADAFAENGVTGPDAAERVTRLATTPVVACPAGVNPQAYYSFVLVLYPDTSLDTSVDDGPDEPEQEQERDDEWPAEGLAFYAIQPDE